MGTSILPLPHFTLTHPHSPPSQGPNLPCFVNRVASHPERLQYIYFNTVLLLRAVARIGPYLQAYDYCSSGTHEEDAETMRMLGKVIGIAGDVGKFDETVLFRGENANVSILSLCVLLCFACMINWWWMDGI